MKKSQVWELTGCLSLGWALLTGLLVPNGVGAICLGLGLTAYIHCLFKQQKAKEIEV
jgi:hypothetical protein